jgi:hypothetical protein
MARVKRMRREKRRQRTGRYVGGDCPWGNCDLRRVRFMSVDTKTGKLNGHGACPDCRMHLGL